jgi:hypothetical protein
MNITTMVIYKYRDDNFRCTRKQKMKRKKLPKCNPTECQHFEDCYISESKLNMEVKKSKQKTS